MQYTISENYSSPIKEERSKWNNKDDNGYVYKKSSYQYSTTGNNNILYPRNTSAQNVNQLDTLLEDLKNERKITREIDILPSTFNHRTIEKTDPSATLTKTTKIYKTTALDDIDNFSNTEYSTIKSNNYSSMNSSHKGNNTLFTDKLIQGDTGNSDINFEKSIYERNRTLSNTEIVPKLHDIGLSNDILPTPGTKVTTTVRTYTYEIPAGGSTNVTSNRSILQNNAKYNTFEDREIDINTYEQSESISPQTVIYNTESYSTIKKNEQPLVSSKTYEIKEHRETNNIHNNYVPQSVFQQRSSNTGSKSILHNTSENIQVSERNHQPYHPVHHPHSPNLTHVRNSAPTTNRYYYQESTNVINNINKPLPSEPNVTNHVPVRTHNTIDKQTQHYVPNSNNVIYKYSSSTINSRGGPDYPNTSTQLAPFPVDTVDVHGTNGNLPQRVDDLMQSFENPDAIDRSEIISRRKKEIETAVAKSNNENIPTVNKAGMDVYYPPGHEMTVKHEEYASGSSAGGRWAKGSGMYEYESGYKSKSKTKSGGAMVPVCLPLCCAMPCSIM